jgi:hypothetical protein
MPSVLPRTFRKAHFFDLVCLESCFHRRRRLFGFVFDGKLACGMLAWRPQANNNNNAIREEKKGNQFSHFESGCNSRSVSRTCVKTKTEKYFLGWSLIHTSQIGLSKWDASNFGVFRISSYTLIDNIWKQFLTGKFALSATEQKEQIRSDDLTYLKFTKIGSSNFASKIGKTVRKTLVLCLWGLKC